MKNLSFCFIIFTAVLIISCGDDNNPNNSNNSSNQTLFSIDSIYIDSQNWHDSIYVNYQNSFNVSFHLTTHFQDSSIISPRLVYWIITGDTAAYQSTQISGSIDSSFSINVIKNQPYNIYYIIYRYEFLLSNSFSYAIIRKFKITAIS